MTPSLWTEADQAALAELVRKRGFADVVLALKEIAWKKHLRNSPPTHVDWPKVSGACVKIFDHITGKRPLE